jgi:hypothetical protein
MFKRKLSYEEITFDMITKRPCISHLPWHIISAKNSLKVSTKIKLKLISCKAFSVGLEKLTVVPGKGYKRNRIIRTKTKTEPESWLTRMGPEIWFRFQL